MSTRPVRSQKPARISHQPLFEKVPQPMWVYDRETFAFLAVNDAAVASYGFSHAEFLAMSIRDVQLEKDWDDHETGPEDKRVFQHRRKDGALIDVEITSLDEFWNGQPVCLELIRDVTQQRLADAQLRDWQKRYEGAVQASGQILYDWMVECDEITYAGSIQEKLGYDSSALAGGIARLTELIHPEDRPLFEKEVHRVLSTHEPFSLEFRLQKKDGTYLYIENKGRFIAEWGVRPSRMVGFLTDVTSRRILEAQFIQAQKMEAVGHLAGGVAHDFNNILGVVMGYVSLLQRQAQSSDLLEYADEIGQAVDRASVLTRQLLAFGKKQALDPRVLNLNSVLAGIEKSLKQLITKDIELAILKTRRLGNVRLDRIQLEQVIINLVINARDAMPTKGKLMIETMNANLDPDYCKLHPQVKPGAYVLLTVTDTGIGMDSSTLARIFEPFFTTKSGEQGTGLGLAMVYGTVRQSGGYIWVYSEPGMGSSFKLYFPRIDQEEDSAAEDKPIRAINGTETVLLAEDEESYRRLITRILSENGYTVLPASDGLQALEAAASFRGPIHLLLTDAVLPTLHGKKLAQELSLLRPELKVLYMSGYTADVVVHHGLLDPGIEFLHKPFTPNMLLHKIRELLDSVALKQ
ncbi:MAG TPA: ATP-binding protein [Candidatus Angelobacter sp.]|nr:ATP-binding protein [Candidatus Angelobacter sp.]